VECCYGVAGSTGSNNYIILEPGSGPISSVDDISSFSPSAAGCADTDILVTSAACAKNGPIDFRANCHYCGY
jgi:hypothetical protein